MDKQDLDLLLQARTSELQHEYENLVRSLDAAYEAVKAIGRDIAENRAEARRLFDTRLKLARGDDLEAVLRLCSNSDAAVVAEPQQNCHQSINKANGRNNKHQSEQQQLPGMVRLYVQQSDANSGTPHRGEAQQQQRFVTVTSAVNEAIPRLRPIKPIQSFDAASLLIEQLQQQHHKQHEQHEQPHYSPVYVGDDHSYAVNEEEEEELAEHQLMLEEGLMVDAGDAKRRRCRESHPAGIDLSIVKTEMPDNSIEEQNPLIDHQQKLVKPAIALTKTSKLAGPLSKRVAARSRKVVAVDVDDEIGRKRKQTRERMRRWRAKKKMEELKAKQSYKYKLVIAKTANA